ncbi:hypothetical protein HXX01_03475, partial [Candidatus Nomurabacteria bacterium]|nr:hypothetical protein [Candidatus Nomurabacteria bacterium]
KFEKAINIIILKKFIDKLLTKLDSKTLKGEMEYHENQININEAKIENENKKISKLIKYNLDGILNDTEFIKSKNELDKIIKQINKEIETNKRFYNQYKKDYADSKDISKLENKVKKGENLDSIAINKIIKRINILPQSNESFNEQINLSGRKDDVTLKVIINTITETLIFFISQRSNKILLETGEVYEIG